MFLLRIVAQIGTFSLCYPAANAYARSGAYARQGVSIVLATETAWGLS